MSRVDSFLQLVPVLSDEIELFLDSEVREVPMPSSLEACEAVEFLTGEFRALILCAHIDDSLHLAGFFVAAAVLSVLSPLAVGQDSG